LAIVIDSMSDTAAKTMQKGKTTKIAASSMCLSYPFAHTLAEWALRKRKYADRI
jgi:hypothetical protein